MKRDKYSKSLSQGTQARVLVEATRSPNVRGKIRALLFLCTDLGTMEEKECKVCKKTKPINQFEARRNGVRKGVCIKCSPAKGRP